MSQIPGELDLNQQPLHFLETDQFVEMLQKYQLLSPLSKTDPSEFQAGLKKYDFEKIYPYMDLYLSNHDLSTPELRSAAIAEASPDTEKFATTLLNIFETTITAHETEYDILGNSPATYFICGVWANLKRGREFHPSSNGITVNYGPVDAYGNQNISYRNKDYEMTLIFEAVQEYTKNLSWTAHRLLIYTLMQGNAQNWRNNSAVFNITDYMDWAGLKSRDAAYRQVKKDINSITGMKLTAESFKKYFESFYTTHLATEASIKKYTGEVRIAFADNVRHFLTQYYQLIPEWMGQLSENAYRMAFYLFYRARQARTLETEDSFTVRVEDVIGYIGLPTKDEVKNRNYDEAILRPFNKAADEIRKFSQGSLSIDYDKSSINAFLSSQLSVGIDETMKDYVKKLEKTRTVKQLEAKARKPRRKKADAED